MKRTGPTNPQLQALISELRKKATAEGIGLWERLASDLELPTRKRREVNLYTISKNLQDNEMAVIPGKVLGVGDVTKPLTVAAFSFSAGAKTKIQEHKGKAITIMELLNQNPKGKGVRIIG